MKKFVFSAILCLCTAVSFGCGNTQSSNISPDTATSSVSADGVDIDLTKMNSNKVYLTIYDMINSPNDYMDKTVKATGNFNAYHDEKTDKTYFAVLISDATACCQQGIEFDLGSGYKYPDDYPPQNALITVTGTFGTYMEDEVRYCILNDASLKRE